MSAHWVEVWSPGLQAIGGLVEFSGALLLGYEWWRGTKENLLSIENRLDKLGALTAFRLEVSPSGEKVLVRDKIDYPDHVSEFFEVAISKSTVRTHRQLYIAGFVFITIGVLAQIIANGMAWGAANGLIR
jgi:hypothetical protein